jgi:hypothetical protein
LGTDDVDLSYRRVGKDLHCLLHCEYELVNPYVGVVAAAVCV